jgi:hypothetical protein
LSDDGAVQAPIPWLRLLKNSLVKRIELLTGHAPKNRKSLQNQRMRPRSGRPTSAVQFMGSYVPRRSTAHCDHEPVKARQGFEMRLRVRGACGRAVHRVGSGPRSKARASAFLEVHSPHPSLERDPVQGQVIQPVGMIAGSPCHAAKE